jgi:hypothetical protein
MLARLDPIRVAFALLFPVTTAGIIFHGAWSYALPTFPEMTGLAPGEWDLIHASNWTAAIVFMFFAALAAFSVLSRALAPAELRFIGGASAMLLWTRFAIEVINPTKIPMVCGDSSVILACYFLGGGAILTVALGVSMRRAR